MAQLLQPPLGVRGERRGAGAGQGGGEAVGGGEGGEGSGGGRQGGGGEGDWRGVRGGQPAVWQGEVLSQQDPGERNLR